MFSSVAFASTFKQAAYISCAQEICVSTGVRIRSALRQEDVEMSVTLRAAVADDAEVCGTICFNAFKSIAEQHGFPPEMPSIEISIGALSMFIPRSDVFSVVAEQDGRLIGSNFLWETCAIAGVGPITVDPAAQNSGAGRRLMDAVLHRADTAGFVGVRLVQSAYHNRSLSLYTRLGFDPRAALSVITGPPLGIEIPGHPVRRAVAADLETCNRVCESVHGHSRQGELAEAIAQGTATVVEHAGRITGYATLFGYFGHAVAETNADMKALIGASTGILGIGFLLPTLNAELLRWCLLHGLRIVQPMTLMSRGLYNEPAGAWLPSIVF
jgi:predicted N-acetyltransferase YhbS